MVFIFYLLFSMIVASHAGHYSSHYCARTWNWQHYGNVFISYFLESERCVTTFGELLKWVFMRVWIHRWFVQGDNSALKNMLKVDYSSASPIWSWHLITNTNFIKRWGMKFPSAKCNTTKTHLGSSQSLVKHLPALACQGMFHKLWPSEKSENLWKISRV